MRGRSTRTSRPGSPRISTDPGMARAAVPLPLPPIEVAPSGVTDTLAVPSPSNTIRSKSSRDWSSSWIGVLGGSATTVPAGGAEHRRHSTVCAAAPPDTTSPAMASIAHGIRARLRPDMPNPIW